MNSALTWWLVLLAGSKFSYSNVGYVILGRVIERATGLRYDQYINRLMMRVGVYAMKLGRTRRQLADLSEVCAVCWLFGYYGNRASGWPHPQSCYSCCLVTMVTEMADPTPHRVTLVIWLLWQYSWLTLIVWPRPSSNVVLFCEADELMDSVELVQGYSKVARRGCVPLTLTLSCCFKPKFCCL